MKLRYLTFDCYGTLIDWKQGIAAGFTTAFLGGAETITPSEIFERYVRLEASQESGTYCSYKEILERTSLELAREIHLNPTCQMARHFANSIETWRAFTDTSDTLFELRKAGLGCYILSNVDSAILELTLSNNHLQVDGYVSAEEIRSYKPAKLHWMEFFRRTGASKDQAIHVANSVYHDINPARELGICTVWVNRYGEHSKGVRADYAINSLSELLEVLSTSNLI